MLSILKQYTNISNHFTTAGLARNRKKGQKKYLVNFLSFYDD